MRRGSKPPRKPASDRNCGTLLLTRDKRALSWVIRLKLCLGSRPPHRLLNCEPMEGDWLGVDGLEAWIAGRRWKTAAGGLRQAKRGRVSRTASTARDIRSAEGPVR